MDVRHVELRCSTRPDGADDVALGDARVLRDRDRSEMRETHGQPRRRHDRDRLAVGRHRAGKGHGSRGGRDDGFTRARADRDAAMLAGGVGVHGIERERL